MIHSLQWLLALSPAYASVLPQQTDWLPSMHPDYVRWGARVSGSTLELTHINVRTHTASTVTVPLPGTTNYLALKDQPAVSPGGSRAAIPIPTSGAGTTAVCIGDNIRAPTAGQASWYLLPERDPGAPANYKIVGTPRFRSDKELWVLEGPGQRAMRLARYRLSPTTFEFIDAFDLDDPNLADEWIAYQDWLIHGNQAVVLQQRSVIGIDVVSYAMDGSVAYRIPIHDEGYAFFQVAFSGIRGVPGHPSWGFLQYRFDSAGRNQALFIDLEAGLKTNELTVESTEGRVSSDGTLAFFNAEDGSNDLIAVPLPTAIVNGQGLWALRRLAGFCCGCEFDSAAAAGGYLVSAPKSCHGDCIHRTRLNASGQLEDVALTTDTAWGPFLYFNGGGLDPATFTCGLMDRFYCLAGSTGHTLLYLDLSNLTYGLELTDLSASVFF